MSEQRINLLPKEALDFYHKSRRATVLTRILIGLSILAFLVTVFAATAVVYLIILTNADMNRLRVVEGSQELRRAGELEELISGFSQELTVLRDLKVTQYDPSFLVREIINVLPVAARIRRLQLSFDEDPLVAVVSEFAVKDPANNAPVITLHGIAETRKDVLDFQHALAAFDFVFSVEAPTENIIYPTNAHFAFELTLLPAAEAAKVKIEASENVDNTEQIEAVTEDTVEEPEEDVREEISTEG